MTNSEPTSLTDAALIEELLADLDVGPAEPDRFTAEDLAELGMAVPAHMVAAQKWLEKEEARKAAEYEARGDRMRQEGAAAERQRYREEVNANPRHYRRHDHAPQQPHESADAYSRRMKRDRGRSYRGVTAEQIEANAAARQAVTPEDRKRKKAEADAARRKNMSQEDRDAEAKRKADARAAKKARDLAEAEAKIAARAIV